MISTFGPLSTTRYAVNGVAFDTIRVPPGRFVDGKDPGRRELLVSRPFEVGVTLVTQALWAAVMTGRPPLGLVDLDLPVEEVAGDEAQAFLVKLDALGFRDFRLPTEVQWAWAARCGVSTQYAGANRLFSVAVADRGHREAVGRLRPSAVGAFDLSGNMWEQQQDRWSSAVTAGVDGQGPAHGHSCVVRGGCYYSGLRHTMISFRDESSRTDADDGHGFRLARIIA